MKGAADARDGAAQACFSTLAGHLQRPGSPERATRSASIARHVSEPDRGVCQAIETGENPQRKGLATLVLAGGVFMLCDG
jgi:hypothetical protein